jgi:hypothetical protein
MQDQLNCHISPADFGIPAQYHDAVNAFATAQNHTEHLNSSATANNTKYVEFISHFINALHDSNGYSINSSFFDRQRLAAELHNLIGN